MSNMNINVDEFYPISGHDNNTQGFRNNFANIKTNLLTAASEITTLQNNSGRIHFKSGVSSFIYSSDGTTYNPTSFQPYSCDFYLNGTIITTGLTYSWSISNPSNSLLSGTSTTSTFTPTLASTFDITKGDNSIALTITYNSNNYYFIHPISITKVGIDGVIGSNGAIMTIGITGGLRTFLYNADGTITGQSPTAFTGHLYSNGNSITSGITYSWSIVNSSSSLLSGTSTTSTFTPSLNSTFNRSKTDNSIALTITDSNNITYYTTIPISITEIGSVGNSGSVITMSISGGHNTFIYNSSGSSPTPSMSAYSGHLYVNGNLTNTNTDGSAITYSWSIPNSTNSLLSLPFITNTSTFTPILASTFDSTKGDNAIALTITYNGSNYYLIQPISINLAGTVIYVQNTTPSNPSTGQIWINPNDPSSLVTGPIINCYISGGIKTFLYNADNSITGQSPTEYTANFFVNGISTTTNSDNSAITYSWNVQPANTLLSGTSSTSTFTPSLNSTFDITKYDNVINLTITYNGSNYNTSIPLSITKIGTNGSTITTSITGGLRTFLYNADNSITGQSPTAYTANLYVNNTLITTGMTYSWSIPNSTNSLLSGTSTTSTFTPTLASTFDSTKSDNSISLTITYNGGSYYTSIPISITQIGMSGSGSGGSNSFTRTSTSLFTDCISSSNFSGASNLTPFILSDPYANAFSNITSSSTLIDPNHPGVITLAQGKSNYIQSESTLMIYPTTNTTGTIYSYEVCVLFPTITTTEKYFLGLYDSNVGNGVYFTNTEGGSPGGTTSAGLVFKGVSRQPASTYSLPDPAYSGTAITKTNYSVSANTWYIFQIVITATKSGSSISIPITFNILDMSSNVLFTDTMSSTSVKCRSNGVVYTNNVAPNSYIPYDNTMPLKIVAGGTSSGSGNNFLAIDYISYNATNLIR